MTSLFLALFLASSLMQSSSSTPNANSTTPTFEEYKIVPDDIVEVGVYEAPGLGGTSRVSASGMISLPLIREIKAAGLDVSALARNVEDALRAYIDSPHVLVNVKEYAPQNVTVLGAVKTPGLIPIKKPKPLFDVILAAGGLGENAQRVIEVRPNNPNTPSLSVRYDDLVQNINSDLNVLIHAGDIVTVPGMPPAGSVTIIGEVGKPGEIPLKSGQKLTIRQALISIGGLTKQALPECTILRTQPEGSLEQIQVNLDRLLKINMDDIALQANDIVYVPSKKGNTTSMGGRVAGFILPAAITQAIYFIIQRSIIK